MQVMLDAGEDAAWRRRHRRHSSVPGTRPARPRGQDCAVAAIGLGGERNAGGRARGFGAFQQQPRPLV